ncbi:MAG: hypothetical protein P1V36_00065 [Planctomycetota bacterium]|nr:hypothetical protein [Planctomycetota bacterium]
MFDSRTPDHLKAKKMKSAKLKKPAPAAVAHQMRGGSGAGPHKVRTRDERRVPRKRKHKGQDDG